MKSRAWAGALVAWLRAPGPWRPRRSSRAPWFVFLLVVLFGLNHLLYLRLYVPPVEQGLESIEKNGTLVVLTRLGQPPGMWVADGLTGFDCEAMRAFGKSLGVEVEFRIYSTEQRLMQALAARKGHVAAAKPGAR